MGRPEIVAHRGGASLYPENSLAAFRHAAGLGVEQAELDVHLSAEGEVVVLHDAVLDRTTSATGPVRDLSREARRRTLVRGGGGAGGGEPEPEPVPTLGEALDVIAPSGLRLRLEIKTDLAGATYRGIERPVMEEVEGRGLKARVVVISFDLDSLRPFARGGYATSLCLSGLGIGRPEAGPRGRLAEILARLRDEGVGDLGADHYDVDAAYIDQVAAAGLTLGVWTVNGPARLDYWLRMPVSYVTTDQPDLALASRAGA